MSFEDYHFLMELQQELTAQSNDGNADPVYWGVMETREVGVPEGCGDAFVYFGDGIVLTLEETVEWVNERINDYSKEVRDYWGKCDKNCMYDLIDFIQERMGHFECTCVNLSNEQFLSQETGAFLTKRACQNYIDNFGYNHSNPHTYAMTAYRNFELERLLKILREGLDFSPTKSIWHKLTEDADLKRFIVLSDNVGHISQRLRWPVAEFVRNSEKKNGIIYTKWAYQDDIYSMREIKFRGYNPKNGHWLHGFYLQNRGNHFVCPDEFANGNDWDDYEILPDTLGQYTGLKDKKGQEIYEGDVLCRYDIWIDTPLTVVYRDGQWIGVAHDGTWLALLQDTYSIHEVLRYIEVIGNTHDNPEL